MRRFSPALVLAALALFVALAGTATAGAVKLISGAQIKDGSITSVDLSAKTKAALKGQTGSQGPAGAQGATGAKGDAGSVGPKGDAGVAGAKGNTGSQGPIGPQGPKGDPGTPAPTLLRLSGDFAGTNATVATTLDGVQFGPYSNGGAWAGSVRYNGANGLTLSQISQLSYTVKHSSADDNTIGSPYLRIFLDGDSHDVIFDATKCATVVPTEDTFHTHEVTTGDVRYDDDGCDGVAPDQQAWATVVAAHGSQVVSGIYVTTGWTGGNMLTAILRSLKVNGTEFVFGAA